MPTRKFLPPRYRLPRKKIFGVQYLIYCIPEKLKVETSFWQEKFVILFEPQFAHGSVLY